MKANLTMKEYLLINDGMTDKTLFVTDNIDGELGYWSIGIEIALKI